MVVAVVVGLTMVAVVVGTGKARRGDNLLEPSTQPPSSHLRRLHPPSACTPLFPPTSPPPPPSTTKPPPSKPLSLPRRHRSLFRCSVISSRTPRRVVGRSSDRPTTADIRGNIYYVRTHMVYTYRYHFVHKYDCQIDGCR